MIKEQQAVIEAARVHRDKCDPSFRHYSGGCDECADPVCAAVTALDNAPPAKVVEGVVSERSGDIHGMQITVETSDLIEVNEGAPVRVEVIEEGS